jgi:hypothetical protein
VASRGNRQELGESLDDAHDQRLEEKNIGHQVRCSRSR